MRVATAVALLLCAVTSAGCVKTFTGRLRTRDPLEEKKLERYRSGTIVLGIGDVDVRDWDGKRLDLAQQAWFEVVSEQEIRFHVRISHKWEEVSQLGTYRIRLVTDRGDELPPADVFTRSKVVERHDNSLAQVAPGGTSNSPMTYSVETITRDLHGADAVIVFRHPRLVAKDVRTYRLLLDGKRRRLHFIWDLVPKAEMADEE